MPAGKQPQIDEWSSVVMATFRMRVYAARHALAIE